MQVNILEAKNQLSQLIKAAQAGEDVVIANRGRAVVRLVPVSDVSATAPRGSAEAILGFVRALEVSDQSRRNAADIDAGIEAERNAWD